ncbi:MAG: hypothetical protein M1269_00310 [Chloroflexi bacterium]|nr:hypothetical protein [Chloroflexota bacterium]
MESAIFVTRTSRLHHWNPTYSRLYYGQEFCERLVPSEADLITVSEFVSQNRVNSFTFVTPFVTEKGYEKLTGLVPLLDELFPGCEVAINDWGVFSYFMEHGGHPVVLGRLLTKQKRGPRILNLTDKIPEAALDHFKMAAVDSPIMTSFLRQNSVGRVELDNLLFGIKREKQDLAASLYYPYGYISTTRICLFSSWGKRHPRAIAACAKECREKQVRLTHRSMPVPLILKGNAIFYEKKELPEDLESLNIDRLVYQPEVPAG